MDGNMDVILALQELFWNILVKVQLTHVHSHQDEIVSYNELSMSAELNTLMDDELADQQYKRCTVTEHEAMMLHLDAQEILNNTQVKCIRI